KQEAMDLFQAKMDQVHQPRPPDRSSDVPTSRSASRQLAHKVESYKRGNLNCENALLKLAYGKAFSHNWKFTQAVENMKLCGYANKAKMGRRQYKSAYNIIKNKTTPESSPPPTPKSDYCNADKAEENDLKKSLMKMLERGL
ncbi:hypothetical protein STEG23_037637, partial [Scotinomys teguina]